MSPDEYLLVAATVATLVFLVAATSAKPTKKTGAPQGELNRWRRFRLRPAVLRVPLRETTPVIAEEPKGIQLLAQPRTGAAPLRVRRANGGDSIEVTRKRGIFRMRTRVSIARRTWGEIAARKGRTPQITLKGRPPGDTYQLRGSVPLREYEIAKNGRLAALVSWQRDTAGAGPREEYFVEAVKSEDPIPLLAIALAVEVSLG